MTPPTWTEEKTVRLIELWESGKSALEISKIFGDKSRNSVIGKLHREGCMRKKNPEKYLSKGIIRPKKPRRKPAKRPTQVKAPQKAPPERIKAKPAHTGFIGVLELDNKMCRWPIGDPKKDDFHFCAAPVSIEQTYCDEHSALAYQPMVRKGK